MKSCPIENVFLHRLDSCVAKHPAGRDHPSTRVPLAFGKQAKASRVVAELSKDPDVKVEKANGGMGEFSVHLDGQKVAGARLNPFPRVDRILEQVRAALSR